MEKVPNLKNPCTWPRKVRQLLDHMAGLFMFGYVLARERAANHGFEMVRLQAERDEAVKNLALSLQLVGLLRRRLERIPAKERPQYAPEDRFQILQLIRLENWNLNVAAKNLVLNEETLRRWFKQFRENPDVGLFFGAAPWNKLSDGTRWVARKIKELCPIEGTRKIAVLLLQAGIQMSRSTVQRVLREEKHPEPQPTAGATKPVTDQPVEPAKEGQAKEGPVVKGYHILNPKKKNRTWHADLTTFDFVFIRFYAAVVLDGFSRKALALKVYHDAPAMADMIDLVRSVVGEAGKFRFIVTDHGCQFGEAFKDAVKALGGTVVKGRVKNPRFNGKAEAFFKILKGWRRLRLLVPNMVALQKRLDIFREYYNTVRPKWGLKGRTPEQVWTGQSMAKPRVLLQRDGIQPSFSVIRHNFKGDCALPVIKIQMIDPVKIIA